MATTARSAVDQDYLDSLIPAIHTSPLYYRLFSCPKQLFSSTYITRNASKFLNTEWVDIALLRDYLEQSSQNSASNASATRFSGDDQQYLDALSNRQLRDFREYLFSAAFIQQNANKFLDHDWVDIALLKDYSTQTSPNPASSAPATRSITVPDAVHVKIEAQPLFAVKVEPPEIIEISSDSEPDADDDGDSDLEVIEALQHASRSSSTIPPSGVSLIDTSLNRAHQRSKILINFLTLIVSLIPLERHRVRKVAEEDCDDSDLVESDTVWQDKGTSLVRLGEFLPTQKTTVERMEYRDGPASIYPIHRVRTGIVVDLSDPKYWFRDPKTKELSNSISSVQDNDSWDWGGGGARASAKVTFAPGEEPIDCRRIGYKCKGVPACDQLDPALRTVKRFELGPSSRNAVIAAQQETRRHEGNTPEERAALFMKVVRNTKCLAVDAKGNKCRGGPILRPRRNSTSRGHQLFVGCSGWTPKFDTNHRYLPIRDDVDENLLANAFAALPLTDDRSKDTPPCSGIIHPHIGLKKKSCPHAHIRGSQKSRKERFRIRF
ncbi:hypothetical protein C8R45DRAFT_1165737 [Mycena sanguinolenta]|nr:hypothetical protein C8R45DRAFT_1165737 [Mycena sanguinolenta]